MTRSGDDYMRALRDGRLNLPELHEAEQSDHDERHPEHHNHPFRHELLLRRARPVRNYLSGSG